MRFEAPRPAFLISSTSARVGSSSLRIGEDQVGEAQHDREHVVEVVRDPAGELTDGLHLLRLTKLLFALAQRRLGSRPGLGLPELALNRREQSRELPLDTKSCAPA